MSDPRQALLAEGVLEDVTVADAARLVDVLDEAAESHGTLTFRDVVFDRVDLRRAVLAGARLERCRFVDCDLERAELTDLRASGTRFYEADGTEGVGCSFRHADLDGAAFDHCDLSLCDFGDASTFGLVLRGCTAQGLQCAGARFTRHPSRSITLTEFEARDCNLSFAEFSRVHLEGAVLAGSRLREAVFDDVVLRGADLTGCDLSAVTARRLDLAGADLRDATIDGLDPRRIDLAGARINAWQAPALLEALGLTVDP